MWHYAAIKVRSYSLLDDDGPTAIGFQGGLRANSHFFESRVRVYDEEIAVEMFETLLYDFDAIPPVLQKCIREKIIPDFDRLIAFM